MGDRNKNKHEFFKPEQCPEFPKVWNRWHDEIDIEKLRKMPMKSTFELDLVNYVTDPAPLQPKSTKNLITFNRYLVSPNKVIIMKRS